jgi:mono/diheme cytochrome c family protein
VRNRTSDKKPRVLALLCVIALSARAAFAADDPAGAAPERRGTELGFAVFQQHCVACHGNAAYERAPTPATLRAMSPERIYTALTTGIMKSVGDTLSDEDRRRIAVRVTHPCARLARRIGMAGAMVPRITASSPQRPRD